MFGITVLSEEGQNWAAQCLPGAEQVGAGEPWSSSVSAAVKQRSFTSFVEILIKDQEFSIDLKSQHPLSGRVEEECKAQGRGGALLVY